MLTRNNAQLDCRKANIYKGSTQPAATVRLSTDGRTQLRCTTLTKLRPSAAHSDSQPKHSSDRAHACRKSRVISSDEAFGRGSGAGRMLMYSSLRAATSSFVCRRYRADTATSCCPCAALRPSSGCAPGGGTSVRASLRNNLQLPCHHQLLVCGACKYRLVDPPQKICRHHHWLLPLRRA